MTRRERTIEGFRQKYLEGQADVGIKAEIHLLAGATWLADILDQGIGQGNSDVVLIVNN